MSNAILAGWSKISKFPFFVRCTMILKCKSPLNNCNMILDCDYLDFCYHLDCVTSLWLSYIDQHWMLVCKNRWLLTDNHINSRYFLRLFLVDCTSFIVVVYFVVIKTFVEIVIWLIFWIIRISNLLEIAKILYYNFDKEGTNLWSKACLFRNGKNIIITCSILIIANNL